MKNITSNIKLVNWIGIALLSLCFYDEFKAQVDDWPPYDQNKIMVIRAVGTGNTTGHIITLTFYNQSNEENIFQLPSSILPSIGKYQSYVIPSPTDIVIPASSIVNVNLYGYCIDLRKPPIPNGVSVPPIKDWVPKNPNLFDNNGLKFNILFNYWGLSIPLTTQSLNNHPKVKFTKNTSTQKTFVINFLPYSDDDYSNTESTNSSITDLISADLIPQLVRGLQNIYISSKDITLTAPLIFDAIEKIIITTDLMISEGQIYTPFSNNKDKEREAVIQHTLWRYVSVLNDDEYTMSEFQAKMDEQLESVTSVKKHNLPQGVIESFDQGVADFWNTFNLVGSEAKIISSLEHVSDKKSNVGAAISENTSQLESNKSIYANVQQALENTQNTDSSTIQNVDNEVETENLVLNSECVCDSISLMVELYRGKIDKNKFTNSEKSFGKFLKADFADPNSILNLEISLDPNLKAGESFKLHFRAIELYCHCDKSDTERGVKCDYYKNNRKNTDDKSTIKLVETDEKKKKGTNELKASKDNNFKYYEFVFSPNGKEKFVEISFEISGYCYTKYCGTVKQNPTLCKKKLKVHIKNKS